MSKEHGATMPAFAYETKGKELGEERPRPFGRYTTPEEWLDQETRKLMATWKRNGCVAPYASRGIANAAHGINHPHRHVARRIKEASEQHVNYQLVKRWIELLDKYTDLCYGLEPNEE